MDIRTDTTSEKAVVDQPRCTIQQKQKRPFLSATPPLVDILLVLGVAVSALIPRIFLALQLDVVTDEVVYILGGKLYFPLLTHFNISSNQWRYNYEHPPFVKLLIGGVLTLNDMLGHPLAELFAARIPSILFGTLLVIAIFWLGRGPFGRVVALLAALCLAVSPWLVYFSALAYLDMTMTALISIAFLLVWHAIRHPWLYLVIALLVGLAAASKYTAVLAIPGMVLFTLYYFLGIRFRIPSTQHPRIPWLWWLGAIVLAPLTFLASDPAIWPSPLHLLDQSFHFEINHSIRGHLTFIAGHYDLHVPQWSILYIIIAKISTFVTVPAALFVLFALIQLVRFYFPSSKVSADQATSYSFLLIWLLSITGMFSLLNIVVGTHYHLPMAAPVALAGAAGLTALLRYRRGQLFVSAQPALSVTEAASTTSSTIGTVVVMNTRGKKLKLRAAIVCALLTVFLIGPHLVGLTTVYAAEGYTSEFFHGENNVLQVAYPGYREGIQWLTAHTHQPARVGLVALIGTLTGGDGITWLDLNKDLSKRLTLIEAHPTDTSFLYSYLIWPMHLIQRGYQIPERWRAHIVYTVMGGNTVYCYVMERFANTVSP